MSNIVSLSGGKDSTAMLLMMLERKMPVDAILMFDGGWEFPQMYDHLEKLERNIGRRIERISPPHPFGFYMFDYVLTKGRRTGSKGYGWPRPMARWCTKLKTTALDKRVQGDAVQCVGIAADEPKRIKDKRYPLAEWGVTEADALDYCLARGYDWGGLYEHFDRVSCWCCPLKSLDELRSLRHAFPNLWQTLKDMDARSYNDFKIGKSVEQLEERFALEDCQLRIEWDEVSR